MKKIAVIIPAYNEGENILYLTNKLNKLKFINKIYIVDDSNNDYAKKKIKNNVKIQYFNRGKKLGRGSAVLFGIKKIIKLKSIDTIIEMDADLSHNPNELNRNLRYFKKQNLSLLISSRYLSKSKIINWSLRRKILSKLSNILAKLLLGVPVTDYTNGYRIYSKKTASLIIKKCGKIGDGFIILSEVLLCIYLAGFKIGEIDTKFVNRIRGESSVNLGLIFQSLIGILKLFFNKKKYK